METDHKDCKAACQAWDIYRTPDDEGTDLESRVRAIERRQKATGCVFLEAALQSSTPQKVLDFLNMLNEEGKPSHVSMVSNLEELFIVAGFNLAGINSAIEFVTCFIGDTENESCQGGDLNAHSEL